MRRPAYPLLLLVCAFAAGNTPPAWAAPNTPKSIPNTLKSMLWSSPHHQTEAPRRPEEPPVARYHPDGGRGFMLDRTSNPPLLRFEDSPEIWILQSEPGPRGDTIYRNDIGQPVLRATRLGGLTLFTIDAPQGAAAAFDGEANALHLPKYMGPHAMFELVIQASERSSHAAQRFIPFSTVGDATPDTAALVAESAIVTSEAIVKISHTPNGHTVLTLVSRVLLAKGGKADVQLSSGALTVTYSLEGGGDWPSSERIVRTVTK